MKSGFVSRGSIINGNSKIIIWTTSEFQWRLASSSSSSIVINNDIRHRHRQLSSSSSSFFIIFCSHCVAWNKKVWGCSFVEAWISNVMEWEFCIKYIFAINLTLLYYEILEKLVTCTIKLTINKFLNWTDNNYRCHYFQAYVA